MNSPQYPRKQFFRKQQRMPKQADGYSNDSNSLDNPNNQHENNNTNNTGSYSREDLLQYGHSVNFLKQNISSVSKDIDTNNLSGLSGGYFFPFSDSNEFPKQNKAVPSAHSWVDTQKLILSTLRFFFVCLKTLFTQLQKMINEFLRGLSETQKIK